MGGTINRKKEMVAMYASAFVYFVSIIIFILCLMWLAHYFIEHL